ncbi:GNAT family N-acetyltransferase [Streptacidiphilus carbonis]|uniref:GNAT family N-acetyltransferase n=1 Tax=Streptacidiphilus carbonis TaxID=105422 RepID=UPI0005AAF623|nr:GNAT family N-acetyltransferase [Streptacidiphilus carbonis]
MDIRVVGYAHPDAQRLIAEVQQEYVRRYGDVDLTPVEPGEFDPPQGLFAVVYDDRGEPVGTGAWRARDAEADEPGLADGDAELKRMYTVPSARGRGVARAVLRFLEAEAYRAGRLRLVLETGTEQPEALALYASEGYLPIEKFGIYRGSPLSVCLAKGASELSLPTR